MSVSRYMWLAGCFAIAGVLAGIALLLPGTILCRNRFSVSLDCDERVVEGQPVFFLISPRWHGPFKHVSDGYIELVEVADDGNDRSRWRLVLPHVYVPLLHGSRPIRAIPRGGGYEFLVAVDGAHRTGERRFFARLVQRDTVISATTTLSPVRKVVVSGACTEEAAFFDALALMTGRAEGSLLDRIDALSGKDLVLLEMFGSEGNPESIRQHALFCLAQALSSEFSNMGDQDAEARLARIRVAYALVAELTGSRLLSDYVRKRVAGDD